MDSLGHGADAQPIVVLGGFLSTGLAYRGMASALQETTGAPVSVVNTRGFIWLLSVSRVGWGIILRQLDKTVRRAARLSPTGKITLVGHSAGGVLGRLYLAPEQFLSRTYDGRQFVSQLITLGSPHHTGPSLRVSVRMARWVESHYPGAYFAPEVRYVAVAGRYRQGDPEGDFAQRQAYRFYAALGGDGRAWGDGLIPLAAQHLHGAHLVTLDGVSHHSVFGAPWYGDADVVRRWWAASVERGETI